MNKNILIILFIFLNKIIFSQSGVLSNKLASFPQEKIYLQINTNFLLTGEKFYYKIYNLNFDNNNLSFSSKIAYVELLDSNNQSVKKQKINLTKGEGYGDFFISPKLKSGTYKLISYNQWMKNENIFFEENLFIVNAFEENEIIKPINSTPKLLSKKTLNSLKNYSKREKVNFNFKKDFKEGNYSVSIRKVTPNTIPPKKELSNYIKKEIIKNKNDYYFLPELRGELIQGKITTKKPEYNLYNLKIALSTTGNSSTSKIAITDNNGFFYFNLKDFNTSKVLIQILDENREFYDIKLINNHQINKKFTDFEFIKINTNLVNHIKERAFHLQVENSYKTIKQDSLINSKPNVLTLNDIEKSYLLDDYKRFNTVKEIVVEVLENVFFTKENSKYSLHVRESENLNQNELPTLLIVDGHVIFDHDEFFNLKGKSLKKISVVRNKYIYGSYICQGIISVETFKNDFISKSSYLKSFEILEANKLKKYYSENYNKNSKKRVPDYRNQLCWIPKIDLSIEEISFYTSDVDGVFEVNIEGFSKSGLPVSYKKTFTVK